LSIRVRFLSAFQDLTEGRKVFTVEGDRVLSALQDLEGQVPGLREKLRLSEGTVHPAYHLLLLRKGRQLLCQDLHQALEDGDELVIAPVIGGG